MKTATKFEPCYLIVIVFLMNITEIIKVIRNIRKERKYSQAFMAEKLGISLSQYGHYETGHSEMSLNTFIKILEILEVDIIDFFKIGNTNITSYELENIIRLLQDLKMKL